MFSKNNYTLEKILKMKRSQNFIDTFSSRIDKKIEFKKYRQLILDLQKGIFRGAPSNYNQKIILVWQEVEKCVY